MSQQFVSLLALPATLTGTVAANRFVSAVFAQSGADANAIGVSRTGGVSGDRVTVDVEGTAVVEAGAAVAAGATIKADALGRAIPWVTSGARVAIALEAASAAGQFIEVLQISNAA